MKRSLLIACGSILSASVLQAQTIIYQENFDTYTAGAYVAETAGDPWTTWGNAPGTTEDVMISDEQANSAPNSMLVATGTPAGGPGDMVLKLGNRTEGVFGLSWMMYIPSGFGGYFNLQHNETIGSGSWMIDVTFRADGTVEFMTNGNTDVSLTYPHDEWFDVSMGIDLSNMMGGFSVNGEDPLTFATNTSSSGGSAPNQLGAVNIFAYAGGTDDGRYFIDDIFFVDISGVGVEENATVQTSLYPNPVRDQLTIELPGNGNTAVVSVVDLTGRSVIEGRGFDQQGEIARMQLDMSALPQGLYLVRIQNGDEETVHRVVRE